MTSARAMPMRCCWPPDMAAGMRWASAERWTPASACSTRFLISAGATLRGFSPKATLSKDAQMRKDRVVLEDHADVALVRRHLRRSSPSSVIEPEVRSLKPAMARSSVVLPQPLGPRSVKNSPRSTETETFVQRPEFRRELLDSLRDLQIAHAFLPECKADGQISISFDLQQY
jgi:hypothetical protein